MRKVFGIALVATAAMWQVSAEGALKSWSFDAGENGFAYDSGWDYQYSGGANTSVQAEGGRLKVNADYSADGASGWSQLTLVNHENISIKGADSVSFDLYYDGALLKDGAALKAKVTLQDGSYKDETMGNAQADTEAAADAMGLKGYKLTRVTVLLDKAVSSDTCATFALALVGSNTDYKGAFYIDNIDVGLSGPEKDVAVDSTVPVTGAAARIAVSGAPSSAAMVDPDADDAARALYAYLAAVPKMGKVIYGHQDDTFQKAGNSDLSNSDTKDVTGSIAGVIGVDALAMTGAEYSADKFNAAHPGEEVPNTPAGGVKAAVIMSKEAIAQGGIITVSAHMPNFSIVKAAKGGGKETYAKWDFGGYTPNNIEGNTANRILPGGDLNAKYNAYLDMIADYASQLGDTILFRPFHECTGSWFWWGAAHCDAEQFKNLYRYTVTYLRDVKGLHNIIYVYGPGMEAESVDDYAVRYPGDEWVDMVGFDSYNIDPSPDDGWFEKFDAQAKVTSDFAKAHGKLFAVTETGVGSSKVDSGDSQTVLHKSGNKVLDWYEKVADTAVKYGASYYLLWANFSKHDGYYTPYVDSVNEDGTLHGHETLDGFINFFNDDRSIFAVNQKDVIASRASSLKLTAQKNDKPLGFISAPVSGSRLLKAGAVNMWVKNTEGKKLEVRFTGEAGKSVTIPVSFKKGVYSAKLKGGDFKKLGTAEGSVELIADGAVLASNRLLINLKEVPDDPMVVDDFEKYMGSAAVLNNKWAVNKDAGCTINISIDPEAPGMDGSAYKFEYKETATGWAGATMNKAADWTKADALQFKTIPDGNNQLVVIQITAGGKVYEAYMNEYDAYRDKTDPMTVTIPFVQFASRDEGGKPRGGLEKDKGTVTSFGLWLNAIKGTPAVVDGKVSGTIWYDSIKAVKSGKTEVTIE